MAQTPRFKIYTEHGVYIGSIVRAEDAAMCLNSYGAGATIRDRNHKTVLYEKTTHAGINSYDAVADAIHARDEMTRAKLLGRA